MKIIYESSIVLSIPEKKIVYSIAFQRLEFVMVLRLAILTGYLKKSTLPRQKIALKGTVENYPNEKKVIAEISEQQILSLLRELEPSSPNQFLQFLRTAGLINEGKKIACIHADNVTAMSVSMSVAKEIGVELGKEVGYKTAFNDCISERTVINYMTGEIMLNELLSDPKLSSYNVIIIGEARKGTLYTNLLLGFMNQIALSRPDLKWLIFTGREDEHQFSNVHDAVLYLSISEQRYPIDIFFVPEPVPDYIDACVDAVLKIHATEPSGDILVFLTGQEEIEACQQLLQDHGKQINSEVGKLLIVSLYENLPFDMLEKIFEPTPANKRKVVLATIINETILSAIGNIVYVIDTGFERQNNFNSHTSVEMIANVAICKMSANQRASCADLVARGKCYRLYTADAYRNELMDIMVPEIERINLSRAVLMLKSLGIKDLLLFDFLDRPPKETLVLAMEQLYTLGALNHRGELTKMGRRMAEFPVGPMMAKMLLASENYKCSEEVVTIAAMLLANGADVVFHRPKDNIIDADKARTLFNNPIGDHLVLMHVYNKWAESKYSMQWCSENYIQFHTMKRALDIREKLVVVMQKLGVEMVSSLPNTKNIRKAITAGYFYHVARFSEHGKYETLKHHTPVSIHANSVLFEKQPHLVLYHEIVFTTKEMMRSIIEIDPTELHEVAPHYYKPDEPSQ